MNELSSANVNRLYNPELMTDESRLAWENIPPLFAQNTELIRTITGSANISAHFKGSTLVGVGGTKEQKSDIDLVFYVGASLPEYDTRFLTLCAEVYPGFADSSPVSAEHKKIMERIFKEQDERISILAKKLDFEDIFHVKLDGTIVSMDGLLAHLQNIISKIEKNEDKIDGVNLTENEFWAIYLTANFLGSPSIFESNQGQDADFRDKLLGVFLGSAQGRELYSNAIQPTFRNLIVNYEYNDPSGHPEGLQRHRARVANTFDQILLKRQIPPEQENRVINFLRLQRNKIGLQDYEQLHLGPTDHEPTQGAAANADDRMAH